MKKNIQEQIEQTLNSLNNIERAETKVFFTTRMNARLDARLARKEVTLTEQKPVFVMAALIICLLLNIVLIQSLNKNQKQQNSNSNNIQSFSEEYNLNSSSPY